MSLYRFDYFPGSSHQIILKSIEPNTKVFDIGCTDGFFAKALKEEKNCEVVGLELDHYLAARAKRYCQEVFIGDIEEIEPKIKEGYFDYIVFGDILEHTKNPQKILEKYQKFLKPNGKIIISLPNIAFLKIRLELLFGKFDYTKVEILDESHLRFYTRASAKRMIEKSGLKIRKIVPAGKIIYFLKIFPTLFAFQFIYFCEKK